jgi:chromosome segregation ATPase
MTSGQATLAEIERAIADLRDREGKLQARLEGLNGERAKLLEERTASFRELAEVRAKHALADGVIDEADRLQARVAALLSARQRSVDSLKERLAAAGTREGELRKEREALADELKGLEAKLDEIAQSARAALDGDAAYRMQRDARDAAKATHDRAKAKAERAAEDRARKGAPYEADPLFMYLWKRRYGIGDYRPHALVRWADDQVARLVGYSDARASYAALIAIPERLAEHVERLRTALGAEQLKVDAIETRKIEELAGKSLPSGLAVARSRQQKLNAELEKITAEIAEISTALNRYAEGLDDGFRQAVEMSAGFLEKESQRSLVELARETEVPTDDQIVDRIGDLDDRLEGLSDMVEDGRGELEQLSRRREELIRIAADFRRNHYDEPGSVFEPDGVDDLLEELLKGVIDGVVFSGRMRRRQRWDGRPADPFRKSSGFPPFGGRSGGGGGFRTGGRF